MPAEARGRRQRAHRGAPPRFHDTEANRPWRHGAPCEAHWEELIARSGLPPAALRAALRTLRGYLIEHGPSVYGQQLEKAEAMLQDADVQDAPYVALALAIEADGVWSEDRALTRVRGLRVVRTADLVRRAAE